MLSENKFKQFHFKGQKPYEEILLLMHRHWFDIFTQFIIIIVMLSLFFASFFLPFFISDFHEIIDVLLFRFLQNCFLIMTWLLFFIIWIDYYFDVWIVTNERIVNIEQKGLFARNVSELELENIQDITVEVFGIIPTFLNYGNLYIQTAGERERFIFRNVPSPYEVKDTIMNLQKKYETKERASIGAMIRKEIHEELK